jgi:lysophospholipase L1-like esterase
MGNALSQIKKALAALQTAWSIFGVTLVVLLLTESGFRLGFGLKDRLSAVQQPDPRVLAEGYGGADWPIEHYRELESLADRWEPYVYFRQKPLRGETITISADGLRATWQPPEALGADMRAKSPKLLMLGGSTLWGYGARNDQTIPSRVARELAERGWHVELRNLSEIGYVSTQELIALVRELQAGYRPDVVVFYDGVNDTTSALLAREAGLSTNEVNRREEFNLLQSPARLAGALGAKLITRSGSYRFARAIRRRFEGGRARSRSSLADETMGRLADEVVRRYAANIALAESLGRSFGFRALFYWQPVVFTKAVLSTVEREEAMRYAWTEQAFREVHQKIRASSELSAGSSFRNLSAIFDDVKNLVFIDFCHTTEAANRQIAAAMADGVIAALEQPRPADSPPGRGAGDPSRSGVRIVESD